MPRVRKRDGRVVAYDEGKVAHDILQACTAAGEGNAATAAELAQMVSFLLRKYHNLSGGNEVGATETVVEVADIVEMTQNVLLQTMPAVAKQFILRVQRREVSALDGPAKPEGYAQKSLFPDDTLIVERESTGEAYRWDKRRIVDSLVQETDLPAEEAEPIAERVEQRIYGSGLRRVSSSLVRELLGSELFERGWVRQRDRLAALGLSTWSLEEAMFTGRPGEDSPSFRDPTGLERHVHASVLKRYALQEIHAPDITEAHVDGRLHLHGLDAPLRLRSLRVCPEGIKFGWPQLPPHEGGPRASVRDRAIDRVAAPANEEQFLALLRRYAEECADLTDGPMTLGNLSLVLAPLVAEMEPAERRGFLRRTVGALSGRYADRLRLEFPIGVPGSLTQAPVVGLQGRILEGERLGDYDETVRDLARDAIGLLLDGAHQALLAPEIEIAIDPTTIGSDANREVLAAAVHCATQHGAPALRIQRPARGQGGIPSAGSTRYRGPVTLLEDREAVVVAVSLNLPQAAYRAGRGNDDAFSAECEALIGLARRACDERYHFLTTALARLANPLLAVGRGDEAIEPDRPRSAGRSGRSLFDPVEELDTPAEPTELHPATLDLSRCHGQIPLVGLAEAMAYLTGEQADGDRPADAETLTRGPLRSVSYLGFALGEMETDAPFEVRLAAGIQPNVAERFHRIDARTNPQNVESLAVRGYLLPGEHYAPGVRLPGPADPAEVVAREARFHALLDTSAEVVIPRRTPTHETERLLDVVAHAIRGTSIHGLSFPVAAISCPSCGTCQSTPIAQPDRCPSCGYDTPDRGTLKGNRFHADSDG